MSKSDNEKTATLSLQLKADSGYTSKETTRISVDQWTKIQEILYKSDKKENEENVDKRSKN
jgi:hypothetical protein